MDIFSEKTILSVSRLTGLLRGVLEENFEQVWVEGEVSNLSFPSSGHCYFTLKDSGAQIRCVMFRGALKNLRFRPSDGMGLIVRGHISVYDQRGEYQLICEYLEPAGIGALQAAFMQLKERLGNEGLFDEAHKKPMPFFPRRIGIITSPTGAAIHDMLTVLKRRFASLEVQLYPVRVQGEGAALEIARAIEEMNRLHEVDILIVGRGGGSLEDLWAFNEEVLARAVYRSRIPVISAVGHETDTSICDFVADMRAPTPSAAAELVITSADELRGTVAALRQQLSLVMKNRLTMLDARISAQSRALHDPGALVGHLSQRVDDLSERLESALAGNLRQRQQLFERLEQSLRHNSPDTQLEWARQRIVLLNTRAEMALQQRLDTVRRRFDGSAARLDVLSPLKTLERGYAVVRRHGTPRVISDSTQLKVNDRLDVTFAHGTARCSVEEISPPGA